MDEKGTTQTRRAKFGNPDFFLMAYVAVWGVDLDIERFGPGGIGWLLGTPIAAIGLVVSLIRWHHLRMRQKVCFYVLLIVAVFGAAVVLPAL